MHFRETPLDVFLSVIDGGDSPFQVILGRAGYEETCDLLDEQANPPCVPRLAHSCRNPDVPAVADPAIRLNTVVRAAAHHLIGSICESNDAAVLRKVGDEVVALVTRP